jgi:hypothetical protein
VHRGERTAESAEFSGGELPGIEQPVELHLARKLAHPNRVFDRFAIAAETRCAIGHRDRHDVDVQRLGKAAIEADFFFTEPAPQRERREIEETEVDGLLDLVGEFAGEEHPRDVCLHQLDAIAVMRVCDGARKVPE